MNKIITIIIIIIIIYLLHVLLKLKFSSIDIEPTEHCINSRRNIILILGEEGEREGGRKGRGRRKVNK